MERAGCIVRDARALLLPTSVVEPPTSPSFFSALETEALFLSSTMPPDAVVEPPASMSQAEQRRLARECPLIGAAFLAALPARDDAARTSRYHVELISSQVTASVVTLSRVALANCTYTQELLLTPLPPSPRAPAPPPIDIGCGCAVTVAASPPSAAPRAPGAPSVDLVLQAMTPGAWLHGPAVSEDDPQSCGPPPDPRAAAAAAGAGAPRVSEPTLGQSVQWAQLAACEAQVLGLRKKRDGEAARACVNAPLQQRASSGPLCIRLPVAAGAGSSGGSLRILIRRSYAFNVLPDGHILVVGVPLPPRGAGVSSAPSIEAVVRVSSLDDSRSGGSGGGFRRVNCPTHATRAVFEGGLPGSAAGPYPRSVTVSAYAFARNAAAQPPHQLLCLFEAADFGCQWPGLRGVLRVALPAAAGDGPAALALPAGLASLLVPSPEPRASAAAALSLPPALLDPRALPRHIAVVMDGNGRWATQRGLPRTAGEWRYDPYPYLPLIRDVSRLLQATSLASTQSIASSAPAAACASPSSRSTRSRRRTGRAPPPRCDAPHITLSCGAWYSGHTSLPRPPLQCRLPY